MELKVRLLMRQKVWYGFIVEQMKTSALSTSWDGSKWRGFNKAMMDKMLFMKVIEFVQIRMGCTNPVGAEES